MSLPGSYKKFRRVIRYIISIVILLLIIVGAAAVGLRLYFNDQRLRAKLMHAAESYLNGQLDVGELDISIFSSISINDLYLLSETDTIFGCSRFSINYNLNKLIAGELVVTGASLENPVINLRISPEGEIDLSWLNAAQDSFAAQDTLVSTAVPDTIESGGDLPVTLKLNSFSIRNLKTNIQGEQSFYVSGLDVDVFDLDISSVDSLSAHVEINLKNNKSFNTAYQYSDSLGIMSCSGNLALAIVADISPGNRINGNIEISGEPIYSDIYGLKFDTRFSASSDIQLNWDEGELNLPNVILGINNEGSINGSFSMGFSETDTVLPIELHIDTASINISDFQSILSDYVPGLVIDGIISIKDVKLISNEKYPGMLLTVIASISDGYITTPEYGLDVNNIEIRSMLNGILSGKGAGYNLNFNCRSDTILYRMDDTTVIEIPSMDFGVGGTVDSLFMPDSLNIMLSLNGIFNDTLFSNINIQRGIPPGGIISFHAGIPEISLKRLPYSEYSGYGAVELNGKIYGDMISFDCSAGVTECLLKFQDDRLFIPELPVVITGQVRYSDDFTNYEIKKLNINSPSLFDITAAGFLGIQNDIRVSSLIKIDIDHRYLEDFIPVVLRDSFGSVVFTGNTASQCSISVSIDKNGEAKTSVYGKLQSHIGRAGIELYGFQSEEAEVNSMYEFINNSLKMQGDIGVSILAMEDSLIPPFKNISGRFITILKDTVLSWRNTGISIGSHHLRINTHGRYIIGDSPVLNLKGDFDFYSNDTVAIYENTGIKGRLQGRIDLTLDDTSMTARGSINPLMFSVISPKVFNVNSLSGNLPFEQRISLPDMTLLGEPAQERELNILDYEQSKYYGGYNNKGTLSFSRLEAGRVFIENFELSVEINNSRVIGRRLYSDVYGGNMLGDFYLDLNGLDIGAEELEFDNLRYAANLQLSSVNFDRLAGSKNISHSADISGDLSITGKGLVDPEKDYELEGQINITRIGPRATRALLDFLDPTGTDISIAETRKLMDRKLLFLDISYQPKSFSIKIKHGNVNPSINMDQPFFAKYLHIGAVTMPVEYDRKQLQALMKAAAVPIEE